MRVAALYIYPVKACRAVALDEATLGALGLDGDRRFAFVGDDGRALTQRDVSSLAALCPTSGPEALHLDLGGLAQLDVPFCEFAQSTGVDVWGYQVAARAAPRNKLVEDYLGAPARLVMLDPRAERAFVDSRPVLVTTTGMLAELGLPGVGMERFRPNVVLEGAQPWTALTGEQALLERDKPCGRCEVTTVDQASGERLGPEPLRTLSEHFERNFGVYYRVARSGRLKRGEALQAS